MQDGFPKELLSQPITKQLAYFKNKVVAHPKLKQTHNALLNAILYPTGASLILVFGPTGVGKTTLRLKIENQLIEESLADLAKNQSRIPIASMEAIAPESGNFKWKDYYTRALLTLDEPLVEKKIDYGIRYLRRDGTDRLVVSHAVETSELRRALEKCLFHRQLTAFIIDEAQHLKKMASGRRLLDQMDTIKSLATMTNTLHILVGTYDLLGLADLSAQLNRRTIDIHFPRYLPDSTEDIIAFKSVLLTFQRYLPLKKEPDLVSHYDYFYEHSAGCIGILKDWLYRSLVIALENDEKTLSLKILEQYAEPTRKLLRIAREIKEGEESLLEKPQKKAELRMLLGINENVSQRDNISTKSSKKPTAKKNSPGKRKPKRDFVGKNTPD